MYLIHWPKPRLTSVCCADDEFGEVISKADQADILDTWQGMEECKQYGFTKSIGVAYPRTNYIELIMKNCVVPPSNIQVECHLLNSNYTLSNYCEKNHIIMSCCFPLGAPLSWVGGHDSGIISNDTVAWVSSGKHKTPSQIALRYLAQRSLVVLSMADTPEKLEEEYNIHNFSLSSAEMTCLDLCNTDYHVTAYKRLFQPKRQHSSGMSKVVKTPILPLNDGHGIPAIGLGTFQGNYDYSSTYNTVVSSVKSAIDLGYRHFDTAYIYDTEKGVGDAIKEKIEEEAIKRSDVFVTTKLWCTSHRRDDVVPALKKSLENMGMDYVDMFLVHWPIAMQPCEDVFPKDKDGNIIFEDDKTDFIETWQGMEECKTLGLAKSIGVSNFNRRQLERLLDNCKIPPANLQVEGHVHNNMEPLSKLCKEKKIIMSCFSPLGKPSRSWKKDSDPDIFTDPTLQWIAEKHHKTNAQIALRFLLQRGNVIVPKSNNKLRQRDNIGILEFKLNDAEMGAISTCNKDHRILWLDNLRGSKEYPFTEM